MPDRWAAPLAGISARSLKAWRAAAKTADPRTALAKLDAALEMADARFVRYSISAAMNACDKPGTLAETIAWLLERRPDSPFALGPENRNRRAGRISEIECRRCTRRDPPSCRQGAEDRDGKGRRAGYLMQTLPAIDEATLARMPETDQRELLRLLDVDEAFRARARFYGLLPARDSGLRRIAVPCRILRIAHGGRARRHPQAVGRSSGANREDAPDIGDGPRVVHGASVDP